VIRYSLSCAAGHEFESWFKDSAAYDKQSDQGHLSCPVCGSPKVSKTIMAPQVARKDRETRAPSDQQVALASPEALAIRAKLKELRELVVKNSDYVGDRFAEEARQMHEGEIDQRSIFGEATAEDVKSLLEDGIEIHPLPAVPTDRN
jgi:hypothetical protein